MTRSLGDRDSNGRRRDGQQPGTFGAGQTHDPEHAFIVADNQDSLAFGRGNPPFTQQVAQLLAAREAERLKPVAGAQVPDLQVTPQGVGRADELPAGRRPDRRRRRPLRAGRRPPGRRSPGYENQHRSAGHNHGSCPTRPRGRRNRAPGAGPRADPVRIPSCRRRSQARIFVDVDALPGPRAVARRVCRASWRRTRRAQRPVQGQQALDAQIVRRVVPPTSARACVGQLVQQVQIVVQQFGQPRRGRRRCRCRRCPAPPAAIRAAGGRGGCRPSRLDESVRQGWPTASRHATICRRETPSRGWMNRPLTGRIPRRPSGPVPRNSRWMTVSTWSSRWCPIAASSRWGFSAIRRSMNRRRRCRPASSRPQPRARASERGSACSANSSTSRAAHRSRQKYASASAARRADRGSGGPRPGGGPSGGPRRGPPAAAGHRIGAAGQGDQRCRRRGATATVTCGQPFLDPVGDADDERMIRHSVPGHVEVAERRRQKKW